MERCLEASIHDSLQIVGSRLEEGTGDDVTREHDRGIDTPMTSERLGDESLIRRGLFDLGAALDRCARHSERFDLGHEFWFGIPGHDVVTPSSQVPTQIGSDVEASVGDDGGGPRR